MGLSRDCLVRALFQAVVAHLQRDGHGRHGQVPILRQLQRIIHIPAAFLYLKAAFVNQHSQVDSHVRNDQALCFLVLFPVLNLSPVFLRGHISIAVKRGFPAREKGGDCRCGDIPVPL